MFSNQSRGRSRTRGRIWFHGRVATGAAAATEAPLTLVVNPVNLDSSDLLTARSRQNGTFSFQARVAFPSFLAPRRLIESHFHVNKFSQL